MRAHRRITRLGADLTGRSEYRVIMYVVEHCHTAQKAATLAERMVQNRITTDEARLRISKLESTGDAQRLKLVRAINEMLTTPIDREDLYRLSRSVDDVIDNLRDFVRETDLYQPESLTGLDVMLATIADGMAELSEAVGSVVDGGSISSHALSVRKHGTSVRQLFQLHIADLLVDPITADTLKRRELARRLDIVALRMGEAANVLNDARFKRSL